MTANETEVVVEPAVGEYVSLHVFEQKKRFVRSIMVGKAPWGKRGAVSGEAVDGHEVCRDVGMKDPYFMPLLYTLVSGAIQANPTESDVVAYCGDLALKMKDDGFDEKTSSVPVCPRCRNPRQRGTPEGFFSVSTGFEWRINKHRKDEPRYYADKPCVGCYRTKLKEIYDVKTSAEKNHNSGPMGMPVEEIVANGFSVIDLIDPKSFDPMIRRLEAAIKEIVNGG